MEVKQAKNKCCINCLSKSITDKSSLNEAFEVPFRKSAQLEFNRSSFGPNKAAKINSNDEFEDVSKELVYFETESIIPEGPLKPKIVGINETTTNYFIKNRFCNY